MDTHNTLVEVNAYIINPSLFLIPLGVNLVSILLNIESLIRYWKCVRAIIASTIIILVNIIIVIGLNFKLNTDNIPDVEIVFVSFVLVVVGLISSVSPHIMLKNSYKK